MKRTLFFLGAALMTLSPAMAQDIYKMETLSSEDLNGTARFVGMGGSMGSLGADISTMSTNPAGIALFRRSDVSMTGGFHTQANAVDFMSLGKTRASFDQIGFVYACPIDDDVKFINFGFNYHKRRNFKQYLGLDNIATGGLSQSWQMMDLAYVNDGWLDLSNNDDRDYTTPLTLKGYDTQLIAPVYDAQGRITDYEPSNAQSYNYHRAQWGGIQQYDFNMSINWNDQIYGGLTIGAYNVNMHSALGYTEALIDPAGGAPQNYNMYQEEQLSGAGFDVKLGFIFRPIEDSPFRFGVAVHSPIFFDLHSDQYLHLDSPYAQFDDNGNVISQRSTSSIDPGRNEYKIHTPWRFNLSMGTTIGRSFAINAEYEYADFSAAQVRYGGGYDYWYDDWGSEKDQALSREAKRWLKPVSTIKVGAELKLCPELSLRAGYNYVTAPMKTDAYLNHFTASPEYYYSCNTDYVNLSDINRFSLGLGLRLGKFYVDAAYLYQQQTATVYPFHLPAAGTNDINRLKGQDIDLKQSRGLLTIGYKF